MGIGHLTEKIKDSRRLEGLYQVERSWSLPWIFVPAALHKVPRYLVTPRFWLFRTSPTRHGSVTFDGEALCKRLFG